MFPDNIYFSRQHDYCRQAQLPESLDTKRTPRTYANGSWWFDLPLLSFTALRVVLYTDADTPHQHKVGLGEVELFTRTQQYVPGAMVMAIAAKSEDVNLIDGLNAQCCRNAIRCPPGSYCLAGAAHGKFDILRGNISFPDNIS